MSRDLFPLARADVEVGKPIAFPVYDRAGRLLLACGQVVSDRRSLEALLQRGMYVNPRWRSDDEPIDRGGRAEERPEDEAPAPADVLDSLLLPGAAARGRKRRSIPAWRLLHMWSEGGRAEDAMTVTLIGMHEGRSILITAPERDKRLVFVKEGALFHFRGFSGELVYEFDAPVRKVRFEPFPYLHLAWPEGRPVGKRRLRQARRVRTDVPCILYCDPLNSSDFIKGMLTDLSTGGCALQLKDPSRPLKQDVRLVFRLHVGGRQVQFEVEAKPVRRLQSEEPESAIGLAFLGLDDLQRMALHAYVYQRLVWELETPLLAE